MHNISLNACAFRTLSVIPQYFLNMQISADFFTNSLSLTGNYLYKKRTAPSQKGAIL